MATATIFGATGLTGEALTKQLLENPLFTQVITAVRKKLELQHEKLKQVITDYNTLEKYPDLFSSDHIFCCLGTTIVTVKGDKAAFRKVDMEYPVEIAKHSFAHACTSLHIISAMGANSNSAFFYNKVKGEMLDAITQMWNESPTQTSLHFYQPGLLSGERKENRIGEKVGKIFLDIIQPLLLGSLRKYRSIKVSDVAKAMMQNAIKNNSGIHFYPNNSIQQIADL